MAENARQLPRPLDRWTAAPAPDGAVWLMRSQRARNFAALVMLLLAVGFGILLYFMVLNPTTRFGASGEKSEALWPAALLFGGVEALFVGWFVWYAFGKGQWLAGPGRLEIHRQLFGRSWVRRYTAGVLALWAQPHMTPHISYTSPVLMLSTRRGWRRLFAQELVPGEVRALGGLLARITGWDLQETLEKRPMRRIGGAG